MDLRFREFSKPGKRDEYTIASLDAKKITAIIFNKILKTYDNSSKSYIYGYRVSFMVDTSIIFSKDFTDEAEAKEYFNDANSWRNNWGV